MEGLNLAKGYTIWPHYNAQEDEKIAGFVRLEHQSILAIPERSGTVFENGGFRAVDLNSVYSFDHEGKRGN